jgi:hypothetical protein
MGKNSNNDDDDDDLNDLLVEARNGHGTASSVEMTPLNLDHLSEGKLDVPVQRRHANPGICQLACAYCAYVCDYAPKCCLTLALVLLIVPLYFLVASVWLNPTEEFGYIAHDYSSIQSTFDLSIGKIDHWCLHGGNDGCQCEDPTDPQPRGNQRTWTVAHKANVKTVDKLVEAGTAVDIAFLGESVIEEMNGRWLGNKTDVRLQKLGKLFEKNFHASAGADLEGVALGVAGDTVRLVFVEVWGVETNEQRLRLARSENAPNSNYYSSLSLTRIPPFYGEFYMVKCLPTSIPRFGGCNLD